MSMAFPLRKDAEQEEELTTADLAQGNRATETPTGPKPVASERAATEMNRPDNQSTSGPLFPNNELDGLRTRWKEIQTNFVDEPRKAVEQADTLVASAMKRLAEVFADERSNLEKQWDRGDNVSTEDLRVAFQRYRSFFDRLLSV
jgi:hypothetical protein